MVSNHKLEILGNQTKAKNIHHFGAEKAAYSYGTTTTKKPTQNIFQWLQGRKETVLQGRKKLKPSSTDEGDAMTAMKQRFLRENCGCSHPACSHNLICPCMYAGEHWISFNTI